MTDPYSSLSTRARDVDHAATERFHERVARARCRSGSQGTMGRVDRVASSSIGPDFHRHAPFDGLRVSGSRGLFIVHSQIQPVSPLRMRGALDYVSKQLAAAVDAEPPIKSGNVLMQSGGADAESRGNLLLR